MYDVAVAAAEITSQVVIVNDLAKVISVNLSCEGILRHRPLISR